MQPIDMVEIAPGEFAQDAPKQPSLLDRLCYLAIHVSVIGCLAMGSMAIDHWMGK